MAAITASEPRWAAQNIFARADLMLSLLSTGSELGGGVGLGCELQQTASVISWCLLF